MEVINTYTNSKGIPCKEVLYEEHEAKDVCIICYAWPMREGLPSAFSWLYVDEVENGAFIMSLPVDKEIPTSDQIQAECDRIRDLKRQHYYEDPRDDMGFWRTGVTVSPF